jgi:hypothetical protein
MSSPYSGAKKADGADGREEALTFVADYLSSLITATEIESAKNLRVTACRLSPGLSFVMASSEGDYGP